MADTIFDVVVVGSGASGGTLAAHLAGMGVNVAVLEPVIPLVVMFTVMGPAEVSKLNVGEFPSVHDVNTYVPAVNPSVTLLPTVSVP